MIWLRSTIDISSINNSEPTYKETWPSRGHHLEEKLFLWNGLAMFFFCGYGGWCGCWNATISSTFIVPSLLGTYPSNGQKPPKWGDSTKFNNPCSSCFKWIWSMSNLHVIIPGIVRIGFPGASKCIAFEVQTLQGPAGSPAGMICLVGFNFFNLPYLGWRGPVANKCFGA